MIWICIFNIFFGISFDSSKGYIIVFWCDVNWCLCGFIFKILGNYEIEFLMFLENFC